MFEGIEPEQATNWNKQTQHNCHDTPHFLEQGCIRSGIYWKNTGMSILQGQMLVFGFIWNSYDVEIILREVRLNLVFRKRGVERLGLDTEVQRREMGLNDYWLTSWLRAFYDKQRSTTACILFWFCNHSREDKKIAWHSALSSQCSTKGFIRTNKLPKLPMPSATVTGSDQN